MLLKIANMTDPIHPYLVGSYTPSQHAFEVALSGNFAFLSEDTYGIEIVDVSNPSAPYFVSNYNTSGHAVELIADGEYLYVADPPYFRILRFDPTGIEDTNSLPDEFSLSQNYPNPFNAQTTISYSLPTASDVKIDIFDILGRKIETLVSGNQPAGQHSIIWNAEKASSGMYFYRIEAGSYSDTRRCLLLK